jgi:hypothetical protein
VDDGVAAIVFLATVFAPPAIIQVIARSTTAEWYVSQNEATSECHVVASVAKKHLIGTTGYPTRAAAGAAIAATSECNPAG